MGYLLFTFITNTKQFFSAFNAISYRLDGFFKTFSVHLQPPPPFLDIFFHALVIFILLKEAMKKKIGECRKRKWIETLHVSVNNEDFSPEAMENDFEREIVLYIIPYYSSLFINIHFSYKQAQKAVQEALPRLEKMGIAVHRPDDYYAEMAKSDEHMKKVT